MAPSLSKPGSRQPPKRRCPDQVIVKAPVIEHFVKFFVIHSEDDQRPVAKLSPFIVAKVLEHLIGHSYQAKKLHSGDLLVEVSTKAQSVAIEKMKNILETAVTVTAHRTLNTVRGVISEEDLLGVSEDEILEGLQSSGVTAVKRIVLRRDGQEIPSKHLILSFERHSLPTTVKAGYLNCRVRPYVSNPQRCFRCQRFGHGSRSCRGREICAKCGSSEHVADICENTICCSNCKGAHAAYSRACPLWKQEKEILSLKAKENITYLEAKKRWSFLAEGSYADVARRGPAPRRESRATQVSHEDLAVALRTPNRTQELQAPPLPGGGSPAAPLSQDRPAPAAPVQSSRSPTREKKRGSRPHSLERPPTTKELHGSHAASVTQKEAEQVDEGVSPPSTSATLSSGSGRGRGLGSRSSDPPRPAGKPACGAQESGAAALSTSLSTPGSDQEEMEWQGSKTKQKAKKPVIPPK